MTARRLEFPPVVHTHGLSLRKGAFVSDFLAPSTLRAVSTGAEVPENGTLLLWGRSDVPHGVPSSVRIVRVEDGFLRSVGLGADLIRPMSLAFDTRGIYFDATKPSDLEHLLQHAAFSEELVARALALRERVVARGVTKYNVGGAPWVRPAGARRVVLVPGQVESDASLAHGAPQLRKNLDVLKAVRAANPDAYVVYKPHPDVVAGLRGAGDGESQTQSFCNEIVMDAPMGDLLVSVDEVHLLTSQTGFEALMRGKRVVCYGQPFYAGWGLTHDVVPCPRRTRTLTLDELVAGALVLYPTYASAKTGKTSTPEAVLQELDAARLADKTLGRRLFDALVRPLVRRFSRRE